MYISRIRVNINIKLMQESWLIKVKYEIVEPWIETRCKETSPNTHVFRYPLKEPPFDCPNAL